MEAVLVLEQEIPRVFVTNYAGHDYTDAESYGAIVPITKGFVGFGSLDRLKFQVAEVINKSKPHDYLLLSGAPLLSVLSVLVWYHMHERVRILVWDKKGKGEYRLMLITKKNLTDLLAVLSSDED